MCTVVTHHFRSFSYQPSWLTVLSSDNTSILERNYLDMLALEYCKLTPNTYIALIWPVTLKQKKNKEIEAIFNQFGTIVYKKKVVIKNHAPHLLLRHIYKSELWGQSYNNLAHMIDKERICFSRKAEQHVVKAYLLSIANLKKVVACKHAIRKLFHLGYNSIHINDTHRQTISTAQLVFCPNSVNFLNSCTGHQGNNFKKCMQDFKLWLEKNRLHRKEFCVVGRAIKAAYGKQDCSKLFFIHNGHNSSRPLHTSPTLQLGTYSGSLHGLTSKDIILNPENHFYYKGIKFIKPELNVAKAFRALELGLTLGVS